MCSFSLSSMFIPINSPQNCHQDAFEQTKSETSSYVIDYVRITLVFLLSNEKAIILWCSFASSPIPPNFEPTQLELMTLSRPSS